MQHGNSSASASRTPGEDTNPQLLDQYQRFQAFFIALFVKIAQLLNEKPRGPNGYLFASHTAMCLWFQHYMAPECTASEETLLAHNESRQKLYSEVVNLAQQVLRATSFWDSN